MQDAAPKSDNPLDGIGQIQQLKDGFLFTEGPLWDPTQKVVFFSDILANRIHKMTLNDPVTVEIFRNPSDFSNGLALDAKGRLLAAERTTRRVTVTQADGTVTPLAETFEGKKFHGPNDLTVDAKGAVYFTDPPYALAESAREMDFNGVFRISPSGDQILAVWKGDKDTRPNGIILSPDEQRLYFADAANAVIWVAKRKADGTLETPTQHATTGKTPDGMTIDVRENLYVATEKGIEVFSKDGKPWGTIKVPQQPANCTFIGENRTTLLIAARGALFQHTNMPFAGSH